MASGRSSSYAKDDAALRRQEGVDPVFTWLTLILLALGLLMLYSASSAQSMYDTLYTSSTKYFQKQAICAVLGLGVMAVFSRIDPGFWQKMTWTVYVIAIVLLLAVLVVGQSVNGAKRWINIGGLQFQPSEIAKFAVILAFSRLSCEFGTQTETFKYGVMGFGLTLLGILIPLALEKHLSAIMLTGMVAAVIMFISGTKTRYLGGAAVGAVVTI